MRLWAAAAIVLLSGCVTELLGPPEVTTRAVACAVLAPDMDVRLVQHGAPPEAAGAGEAWIQEMAAAAGKTDAQFEQRLDDLPDHDGPWTRQALGRWMRSQDVITAEQVVLRVLWVEAVPEEHRAVDLLGPGVVAVNATAWSVGMHLIGGPEVAQALLFHGLGHATGAVNRGIPLHEADAAREEPQHHEPGTAMDAAWHHVHSFPADGTLGYSEELVGDWRHAQTSQAVCG